MKEWFLRRLTFDWVFDYIIVAIVIGLVLKVVSKPFDRMMRRMSGAWTRASNRRDEKAEERIEAMRGNPGEQTFTLIRVLHTHLGVVLVLIWMQLSQMDADTAPIISGKASPRRMFLGLYMIPAFWWYWRGEWRRQEIFEARRRDRAARRTAARGGAK